MTILKETVLYGVNFDTVQYWFKHKVINITQTWVSAFQGHSSSKRDFLRKGKRAKKRTNVLFFAEGKEVEQSELCSDVSKPHEKNIFGISAVGVDLWNSQKVGSDSEPS